MRTRALTPGPTTLAVLVASLLLLGCGGAAETASDAPTPDSETAGALAPDLAASDAATTAADVTVVLGEWIVEPTPTSGAAGSVTIMADNQGGEAHEVVIARADDPADLPTDENGAVDESQIAEEDFVGEIEEFPNGEQRSGTFEMDAGTYVLFCNITEITDDDGVESHFVEGMATTFTVR